MATTFCPTSRNGAFSKAAPALAAGPSFPICFDTGYCTTGVVSGATPISSACDRSHLPPNGRAFSPPSAPPQPGGQGNLPVRVATCAMQAPAHDPLLLECFERASAVDGDKVPWGSAGPALLTTLINERQLAADLVAPEVFCPIDYWNVSSLLQGPQMISGETHAVHFWNEIWRRNFFDKNAGYDPLSLYERLKARYLGRKGPPDA
jgi:hypothetical protein